MENFVYHIPTRIYFGQGQLSQLRNITEINKKVLLVYGGGSIKRTGLYDNVYTILRESGVEKVKELAGVQPNPRIESVREGIRICREHNLGVVLAVGGGSVIDCSKAIAAGYYHDGDPWDFTSDPSKIYKALPVATVLTLAATGSEMNTGAVITNPELNAKLGFGSPLMRPIFSILDPSLTFTLPARQTAAGVADTMSHIMENYFNHVKGAYLQKELAEALLRTAVKYGPVAIKNPMDYEARANLMWCASLALNGLLASGARSGWSNHPMEHVLSAHYDITHADGLAILTPNWMAHVLDESTAPDFAEFGRKVFGIRIGDNVIESAKEAIRLLRFFFNSLGLPATLHEVGIGEEKLQEMASQAVSSLSNCYVPLTEADVYEIYRRSL